MVFRSLRDWISFLEKKEQLVHNKVEIDLYGEISAISQRISLLNGPAVLHHNIRGYPGWRVLTDSLTTTQRQFWALGIESMEEFLKLYESLLAEREKPKIVNNGPCKEVKLFGDEIDLIKLPIVQISPLDSPPFITAGISNVKDPETGWQNSSIHRFQLKGRRKLTNLILPGKHESIIIEKYAKKNNPCPIAIVIGADPLYYMCSILPAPAGVDEIDAWGKIAGEKLEVVKCETSDILVPATAEIVIEGEMPPTKRELEGPYIEYTGYSSGYRFMPIVEVKAITMRKDAIYMDMFNAAGSCPGEGTNIGTMLTECEIYKQIKALVPEVKNVALLAGFGLVTVVAVDRKARLAKPGLVKKIAMAIKAIHASFYVKNVIIVDDDINIHDPRDVLWCLATRYQAAKDTFIVSGLPGNFLDPSEPWVSVDLGSPQGYTSAAFFDCTTKPPPYDEAYRRGVIIPPSETIEKVKSRWNEYGFK
jgi:UbiD family decarboxylase